MAVDLPLEENVLGHDDDAEEALESALGAWRTARTRLDAIDPARLSRLSRETYFRLLTRIGLWSDARMCGAHATDTDEA